MPTRAVHGKGVGSTESSPFNANQTSIQDKFLARDAAAVYQGAQCAVEESYEAEMIRYTSHYCTALHCSVLYCTSSWLCLALRDEAEAMYTPLLSSALLTAAYLTRLCDCSCSVRAIGAGKDCTDHHVYDSAQGVRLQQFDEQQ